MALTLRQRCNKTHENLLKRRTTWDDHWKEIDENVRPRRSRFSQTDVNKGTKRNQSIFHSAPIRALRIAGAGMAAGISSPARPWFRFSTPDPAMAEVANVRSWLHMVEERVREVLVRSYYYNRMAELYPDLMEFGTQCLWIDEDLKGDERIIPYLVPVGEFCLGLDGQMRVSTVTRDFTRTTEQMVSAFGLDKVSDKIRNEYDVGNYDTEHPVIHCLIPNAGRDPSRADVVGKKWLSLWFEKAGVDENKFLRIKGYDECPAMAPRWSVQDGDAYGWGPGMDALPDCKELQMLARRKLNLVDKITNPPMNAPAAARGTKLSLLPGDINYLDSVSAQTQYQPAYTVVPGAIEQVRLAESEAVQRVREAFMADLFLMMAESDRRQITAEEIRARQEEKMMQLGPVLEGLHRELHSMAIDRTFSVMWRRGDIPAPPKELQGTSIRVEYVSILAQAQRLIGISSVEHLASFTINLAQSDPQVLDKLNTDELVDELSERLGTKPDLVRSDEAVAEIRANRAKAQQAQQQADLMQQASQAARNLGGAQIAPDNALGALLASGGYGPPSQVAGGGS